MKFLNSFKIFEAEFVNDRELIDYHIISDLKDILLEVEDEGFVCRLWVNNSRFNTEKIENEYIEFIEIEISPSIEPLSSKYSIFLYDCIKRLIDFFKINNFYDIYLSGFNEINEYKDIESDIDISKFSDNNLTGYNYFIMEAKKDK